VCAVVTSTLRVLVRALECTAFCIYYCRIKPITKANYMSKSLAGEGTLKKESNRFLMKV
jgi:hypothetical protein